MNVSTSNALADPKSREVYMLSVKYRADMAAMKWYDSNFLRRYETAKRVLQIVRPDVVDRFVEGFKPLRTRPDYVIQGMAPVFDKKTYETVLHTVANLPQSLLERHEVGSFGRDIVHDFPYFTELQSELAERVSVLAGEVVVPCYNFLSLYSGTGVCRPHLDEPSAKWTLDICIDQSIEWPISFSQVVDWPETPPPSGWVPENVVDDPALSFSAKTLRPNTAILFAGSSQWHYRDPIPNTANSFCNLLFFHYIPKGAEALIDPVRWAEHFEIPELDIVNLVFGSR